jgi:anti-sigma B factor antagonist
MPRLKVEMQNGGGDVLLAVCGEVDMATAPDLDAALERALVGDGGRLIVDLREVGFLDSAGLALLVRHDRNAATSGRHLIVVKGPPHVQQVFELTGLSKHLTMVDKPPQGGLVQSKELHARPTDGKPANR